MKLLATSHQGALGGRTAARSKGYCMARRLSRNLYLQEFGHKSSICPQKRRASLGQPKQQAEDETHPDKWEQPKAWGWKNIGGGDVSRSIASCLLEGENSVERHTQFKQVI